MIYKTITKELISEVCQQLDAKIKSENHYVVYTSDSEKFLIDFDNAVKEHYDRITREYNKS